MDDVRTDFASALLNQPPIPAQFIPHHKMKNLYF